MPVYYREDVNKVLHMIRKIYRPKYLIGIDGPGGSGKSIFAKELIAQLPGAKIVQMDDFYKTSFMRNEPGATSSLGGYFDWQRLEEQVLIPFSMNKDVSYQKYDWNDDSLKEWESIPRSYNIIIEGVYSTRNELLKYYDLKIWMDCPADIRLQRGIARDGIGMKEQWQNVWMQQENDYMERQKPFLNSDMVVNGSGSAK